MKDIHSFVLLAYGEKDDLEDAIKSIINQSVKSNVIIVTSTPSDYIFDLASNYGIGVIVNKNSTGKGCDYDAAISSVNTKLVTIAHQDDLYDRNYTKEVIKSYKKNLDALIIFTNYYEIKNDVKINRSRSLCKRRFILSFLNDRNNNKNYFKRFPLKYMNTICTSSVTYVKDNINNNIFDNDLIFDTDWAGFAKLSALPGRFVYIKDKLVGYRDIPKTTKENKIKKSEDYVMYQKFWPLWIVNLFCRLK